MTVGTCRSCGAEIVWLVTPKGHMMPVDPAPATDGNVAIDDGIATVLSDDAIVVARLHGRVLWLSHFATCPDAARHRRRRAA